MNETTTTFDPPQPGLRIETFNMGIGGDMRTVAASLDKIEREEGYEVVFGYAAQSPNGDRVVHQFVMRRKPEAQLEQAITITDASGRSISICAASIEVGKIDTTAPASKPTGKDKRR